MSANPRILITVRGGVVEYRADVGIRIECIDYDNSPNAVVPQAFRDLAPWEDRDDTCSVCGDVHDPCINCGAPTHCDPQEQGEPFIHCDICNAEMMESGL